MRIARAANLDGTSSTQSPPGSKFDLGDKVCLKGGTAPIMLVNQLPAPGDEGLHYTCMWTDDEGVFADEFRENSLQLVSTVDYRSIASASFSTGVATNHHGGDFPHCDQ